MSIYVIDGVRINAANDRVTHVRWGQVNPRNNQWTNPAGPGIDEVIRAVDAIQGGDEVWTVFPVQGQTVLGPQVAVVVYPGGLEGIETADAANHPGRTMLDLPRI